MAAGTPIGKQLINKGLIKTGAKSEGKLMTPEWTLLATFLLQEKRKDKADQTFGAYVDKLPKDCRDWPIFFNDEEMVYL